MLMITVLVPIAVVLEKSLVPPVKEPEGKPEKKPVSNVAEVASMPAPIAAMEKSDVPIAMMVKFTKPVHLATVQVETVKMPAPIAKMEK